MDGGQKTLLFGTNLVSFFFSFLSFSDYSNFFFKKGNLLARDDRRKHSPADVAESEAKRKEKEAKVAFLFYLFLNFFFIKEFSFSKYTFLTLFSFSLFLLSFPSFSLIRSGSSQENISLQWHMGNLWRLVLSFVLELTFISIGDFLLFAFLVFFFFQFL